MMVRRLLLALTLAAVVAPSCAKWEFEVAIYRFSNPNNEDSTNNCCSASCNPCAHYFTFCLRDKNSGGYSCPRGAYVTPTTPGRTLDATTVTFTPGSGQMFGPTGVLNPLLYCGNQWTGGGFQLYIRISDLNTGSDFLVDDIIINKDLTPSIGNLPRASYNGAHRKVSMDMSFTLRCSPKFYGSECIVFCAPVDDSTGHFTCDANGDKVCLDGWTDTIGSCLTPVCLTGCSSTGGSCEVPGECICSPGWNGILCDGCIPAENCEHGSCTLPGECNCDSDYAGTLCNIDQDVCGHQSPCANGATCNNTGDNSYHCDCAPGFTGLNCDEDIDDCASSPCKNGATCIDLVDGFSCNCSLGWEGPTCENDTDECLSSPCLNGGTCVNCIPTLPDSPNNTCELGYTCNCSVGFYGDNCEGDTDFCMSNPCQNGATCHDMNTTYLCECLPGYTGKDCDGDIDECAAQPCKNGGTCQGGIGNYTCFCVPGFTGKDCEAITDNCIDNECIVNNTVRCTNEVDGYKCECQPGYTGRYCELEIDKCDMVPCLNGGTCIELVDDFICQCPVGFTGPVCFEIIDNCRPDLCLNNGTCVNEVNDYSCACAPGYTGKQCEEKLPPPCDSKPCGDNMFCVELPPDEHRCEPCAPGKEGCVPPQPQNGTTNAHLGPVIGGAIGGAIVALLLSLLLIILLVVVLRRCKRHRNWGKIEENYGTIRREGAVVGSNPMYVTPSDIVTSTSPGDHQLRPLTQHTATPTHLTQGHDYEPIPGHDPETPHAQRLAKRVSFADPHENIGSGVYDQLDPTSNNDDRIGSTRLQDDQPILIQRRSKGASSKRGAGQTRSSRRLEDSVPLLGTADDD